MSHPIPAEAVFSVAEFLDLTNEMLKPLRVTVQGEITSYTIRGAAVYFSLSDKQEKAVLNCLMWKNKLYSQGIEIKEGLEVQVIGTPNIYKPYGKFSFQADYISPVGEGALKLAFEKLKQQLAGAGFFDAEAKQPLPDYPQRIGLITSSQGDAIKDFQTHLGEFGYQIFFHDARVEGLQAVDSLVQAFQWFNEHPLNLDVIVVTRGGGSLESLQAFNSEPVAKAIFASRVPVISAIGHENDITIADLVADVRASTPTDAGKIVAQNWVKLPQRLQAEQAALVAAMRRAVVSAGAQVRDQQSQLDYHFKTQLTKAQQTVTFYHQTLSAFFPRLQQRFGQLETAFQLNFSWWDQQWRHITALTKSFDDVLDQAWPHWLQRWQQQLKSAEAQLQLSDPTLKLKQGYSIVMNEQRQVIRSVAQLAVGESLQIRLHQGHVSTKVERLEEYGE